MKHHKQYTKRFSTTLEIGAKKIKATISAHLMDKTVFFKL